MCCNTLHKEVFVCAYKKVWSKWNGCMVETELYQNNLVNGSLKYFSYGFFGVQKGGTVIMLTHI